MKPDSTKQPSFAVDCMLGKLARWLRILGFDATYYHNIDDRELVVCAAAAKRLLLTRDRALAASAGEREALLVTSVKLEEQLHQVIGDLDLQLNREKLFSRCIECGGQIRTMPSEEARGRVPDYVQATQQKFSTCPNCSKIYWNSTHVNAMLERLDTMNIRLQ